MRQVRSVSIGVWLARGSRHESAEQDEAVGVYMVLTRARGLPFDITIVLRPQQSNPRGRRRESEILLGRKLREP